MRRVAVAAIFALVGLSGLAKADILVAIDKTHQQMTVSLDGAPTYRWTVSTGRPGYDTPAGHFGAIRMERVYFSKKYDDAPMPNAVFFYGGYAIHGTFEESRLGNPVSHGCVRLARANAETLFALVRARGMSSTRIVITDGPARDAPGPMAHARDPGFEDFGSRGDREAAPRRSAERHRLSSPEPGSREAWLRSLDRKYGINTR